MELILHISNADKNLLKALKGVISLCPQAKLKVKKEEDVYTKEFIESLDECESEFKEQQRNGTLKTYKSVDEAFRAEGLL